MLSCQKHLFSLGEETHYLNCAYKAPLMKSCEMAAIKALERLRDPSHFKPQDFFSEVDEVRQLFAQIVNCQASEIAIIPSVSYGMSSVLRNVSCRPGQHAITVENEFPSDYFAIHRWCKTQDAELKIIRPGAGDQSKGREWNDRILESITSDTAVVILSSVHWMTGMKFELQRIGRKCKTVGAKLIVDGTQSVGALPINVKQLQIDALVCAAYKWLLGPYSLGLAYISESFHDGIPIEESWMNRTNAMDFSNLTTYDPNYKAGAGRYNMGEASNFILMPMLKAALSGILCWRPERIQAYSRQLAAPLLAYLAETGVPVESEKFFSPHMFGLQLSRDFQLTKLKDQLLAKKLFLSQRGNSLRVAIHVFNTENDISALLDVLKANRIET